MTAVSPQKIETVPPHGGRPPQTRRVTKICAWVTPCLLVKVNEIVLLASLLGMISVILMQTSLRTLMQCAAIMIWFLPVTTFYCRVTIELDIATVQPQIAIYEQIKSTYTKTMWSKTNYAYLCGMVIYILMVFLNFCVTYIARLLYNCVSICASSQVPTWRPPMYFVATRDREDYETLPLGRRERQMMLHLSPMGEREMNPMCKQYSPGATPVGIASKAYHRGSRLVMLLLAFLLIAGIFDSTKGYPGEGPTTPPMTETDIDQEWLGDKMDLCAKTGHFVKALFLNTDGIAADGDALSDIMSIADQWNLKIMGLGDTRGTTERNLGFQARGLWDDTTESGHCTVTHEALLKGAAVATPCNTMMVVHSTENRVCRKLHDIRNTGWFSGIVLQGAIPEAAGVRVPAAIAFLTLYGPTPGMGPDSYWQTLKRTLKDDKDPREEFIAALKKQIKLLHSEATMVVIGGDFNLIAEDPALQEIMDECGMESVLDEMHKDADTWHTYTQSDEHDANKSRIDHVLASAGMVDAMMITRSGIYTPQVMKSRHRPIVVEIDFARALHLRGESLHKPMEPPKRVLQYSNKTDCKKFSDSINTIWEHEHMHRKVQDAKSRVSTERITDALALDLDELAQTAHKNVMKGTECLVKYGFESSTKFKNCYSPATCRLSVMLRRLESVHRVWNKTRYKSPSEMRLRIRNMHSQNGRYDKGVRVTLAEDIASAGVPPPPESDDEGPWELWIEILGKTIHELLGSLHGKKREQRRAFITCITARRQQQYKDGKLKQYIRSVLQLAGSGGLPKVILTRDPITNVPILLTEPDDIRQSERAVMDEWLGRNRDRYFIRDKAASKVDHPTFADTPDAKRKRMEIQYATTPISLAEYDIPEVFRDVVIASKVKKSGKYSTRMSPTAYGDIRSRCITYDEWDAYIAMKSKNVAPGASGVQYVHLAVMPVNIRHDMCDIANLAIQSGHIFTMWKKELIYRIPKEPGNPDQLKQRPLKLQEVMRKITLGIKKNHLIEVWHEHKLISPQQFAFMKGWSTSEPIMIKKLSLELARLTKQSILALDEDLKRAYDQTERFVKEMSLRRFGVPEDMIGWIMEFDRGNCNVVLTAYGETEPFEAEMGAWAQGDDFSPIGWVVTMDWLVSVVRLASSCPVRVGNAIIDAILYADDASYMQRALNAIKGVLQTPADIPLAIKAIQQIADATERYCGFTGHEIRVDKSALQMLLYVQTAQGATLVPKEQLPTLYLRRWQSATTQHTWGVQLGPATAFPLFGPHDELRHLGHTESAMGTAPIAKKLALASTRQAARIMNMKRLQSSGAKYIAEAVIRARAQYRLIYLNATIAEIDQHQASISRMLCKAAHAPHNLPNLLKYGSRGGMHWDKWSDVVNIERLLIIMKGVNSPGATGQLLLASIDQLQKMIGASVPVMEVPVGHLVTTGIQKCNTWIFNIWQWMTHPNRAVSVVGLPAGYTPRRELDANIVEYVSVNAPLGNLQTRADMVAVIQRGCYALDVHLLSDLYMNDGFNLKLFMKPGEAASKDHAEWHSAVCFVVSNHFPLGDWTTTTPPIRLGDVVCHRSRSGEPYVGVVESYIRPLSEGKVKVAWMEMTSRRFKAKQKWIEDGGDDNVFQKYMDNYSCATLWCVNGEYEHHVVKVSDLTALDYITGSNYQCFSALVISDDRFVRKCKQRSRQVMSVEQPITPTEHTSHLAGYFDENDMNRFPDLVHIEPHSDLIEMLSSGEYILIGCSDGSVRNDHLVGTYGWAIALYRSSQLSETACNPKEELLVVAAGSGKCAAADNTAIGPLDSTRMESIGIVAGLEAWKHICECEDSGWLKINWICDNEAADDTYLSHRSLNMRQWQSLSNKDVWGHLDTWCTSEMRTSINVKWHRGHPENRKSALKYTANDWLNVWADAFADDAYSRCDSNVFPWQLPNKVAYYVAHDKLPCQKSGMIVSNVRKTLLAYFQRQNGMTYAENHKNIIPDMNRVDLLRLDQFEKKLKSPALYAQQCKRVWELNFTNTAAHAADKSVSPICGCGKSDETVGHMYYECKAPHTIAVRQDCEFRYTELLEQHFYKPEHQKWHQFWEGLFMLTNEGTVQHWDQMPCSDSGAAPEDADGNIDLTRDSNAMPAHLMYPPWYIKWRERSDVDLHDYRATRSQIRLGSRMLWKGLWAPGLQHMLLRMKHLGIRSEAFLAEVDMHMLDMHRAVWKQRCSHNRGHDVEQRSLKQQEILQHSLQARLDLQPYMAITETENLVRMDSKQLKSWLKHAKSLLRRYSPRQLGLRSFYAPADSVKKGSVMYTTIECRGDADMHCAVRRPVADLVGPTQVMVRERPVFCTDTPLKTQQMNHVTLAKSVLVASVREGCTTREAMQFKTNRGVSIDEYEILMPCGVRSSCTTRQIGNITVATKGKHILGEPGTRNEYTYKIGTRCCTLRRKSDVLVPADNRERFIDTTAIARQWHRNASLVAEVKRVSQRRQAKQQRNIAMRNIAMMLGRSQADETTSMRARAVRERKNSSTMNHKRRRCALKAQHVEKTAMASVLRHIKKKVRARAPAQLTQQPQVHFNLVANTVHSTPNTSPIVSLLSASAAGKGVGAGLLHPERTAGAASGEAASPALAPLVVVAEATLRPHIPCSSSLLVASATDTGAGAGLPNPERTAGAASGEAAPLARVPLVVATVLILPTRRIVNRITSVAGAGADAGLPNPERTASAASGEAASPALVPPAVKTAPHTRKRDNQPLIPNKKSRSKQVQCGTERNVIILSGEATQVTTTGNHTSKGRGSVDSTDMQLQLLQSGLPPLPAWCDQCGKCRAMCICFLDV